MRFFFLFSLFLIATTPVFGESDLENSAVMSLRAGLYDEAAMCYRRLIDESNDPAQMKRLRGQLAYCLHHLRASKELVRLLEHAHDQDDGEKLYLASAYRRLGRYEDALNLLEDESLFDCSFEKALVYYESGDLKNAHDAFKLLAEKNGSEPALLYLARLNINQKAFETAKKQLTQIDDEAFFYEKEYLLGVLEALQGDDQEAIHHLERATPSPHAPWSADASLQLARAYLRSGEPGQYSDKIIETLSCLKPHQRTKEIKLTLAEALLAKGQAGSDEISYEKGIALLEDTSLGHDGWLLRSRWGRSYHERDSFFRRLTHESNSHHASYGEWWLQRGIHDLREAQRHTDQERQRLVQQSKEAFNTALEQLPHTQHPKVHMWQGHAYLLEGSRSGSLRAQEIFSQLLKESKSANEQGSLFYMYVRALMTGRQHDMLNMETLRTGIEMYPSPEGEFLLAILYYQRGEWEQAKKFFHSTALKTSGGMQTEALFWMGKASIEAGDPADQYRPILQQVYEGDSAHPLAAEAYFMQYAYEDYLRGDREAMRHLQRLPTLFPTHYLGINSYYLIGLDRKRDRPSADGKKIHRRDLNGAIEAFHRAEELFDRLLTQKHIPAIKQKDATLLRFYASLERGLANLAIADESEGAKKQIFLEYAQDVFKKILANNTLISGQEPYSPIEEESTFWLAKAYAKAGNSVEAKATYDHMHKRYHDATITRGYFLARMWMEVGQLALNDQQHRSALDAYDKALEAAKGGVLSNDERLNVWIQQSDCYRGLKDYPAAIRILTQVTNENVISGLRLKAMYLRSQLYALQQRPELERNQLKALAKKGGEWAAKARQTLEEKYGY